MLQLLGDKLHKLSEMKRHIMPGTPLFLFNFQSKVLLGSLEADGAPDRDIDREAWGGSYKAQVRFKEAGAQVMRVALTQNHIQQYNIRSGPKTSQEICKLREFMESSN